MVVGGEDWVVNGRNLVLGGVMREFSGKSAVSLSSLEHHRATKFRNYFQNPAGQTPCVYLNLGLYH